MGDWSSPVATETLVDYDDEKDERLVTRSGLRLRIRLLTPEEADRHFWVAMMPYSWTFRRFAEIVATSWKTRTICAGLAALAAWRCLPTRWPFLLAGAVLAPTALLHSLRLLLWLVNTRQLPDYKDFSGYWCGEGPNKLYGVFLDRDGDSASDESLVATVASLHVDSATCELQRLGVLPGHRGHGIGDCVRPADAAVARRGYRRMRLGTTELQRHAVGIYERLGFVRVAQVKSLMIHVAPIYLYERALE